MSRHLPATGQRPPKRSTTARLLTPFAYAGGAAVVTAVVARSLHAPPQLGVIPFILGYPWLLRKGYGLPQFRSSRSPLKRRTTDGKTSPLSSQEVAHGEHEA